MKSLTHMTLVGFAALIAVGTVLLMLPVSTRSGSIAAVDALFTSTSAVCVTGLIVKDTGADFTPFGQFVILMLIQAGGLGIMTLSTGLMVSIGHRISVAAKLELADDMEVMQVSDYRRLVRNIAVLVIGFEAAGALCLLPSLWARYGFVRGLWSSVFHSVSAFCNAGFSLYSDSFSTFRANVWVNVVLWVLIVAGGIGFAVMWNLWRYARRKQAGPRRLTLHTKMVLVTSTVLLAVGAVMVYTAESRVTLADADWGERVLSSIFQSVTPRTAGFNTLPIGGLSNPMLFVTMLLMFIGASPGSTGGGVKTTTFAVLVMMALSRLRGRESATCARRTLKPALVGRAVTVVLISLAIVAVFAAALLFTEQGGVSHEASRGSFLEILFESVSAFGTVGLSMGITPTLTTAGKLLVALLIYIGRLGPLTIVLAIARREGADPLRYPVEDVMIG